MIFRNRLLVLLLLVFFLKEIVFAIAVPIFQTPDEQAHFAQVAYFSELNKMPSHSVSDLNLEIFKTEQFLGTDRDQRGNNKYTYHPEYKLEFTNSTIGKFEPQIRSIDLADRKIFVKQEAARYPQLYYLVTSVGYRFFYHDSIIERVYIDRLISIIISTLSIFIAWLIGKELFKGSNIFAIALATIVGFQPMFSFVSVGISSDNLMTLLFSILIYIGVVLINRGISFKRILLSVVILVLLFFTKPQFILGVPVLLSAILVRLLFYSNSKPIKLIALFSTLFSFFLAYLLVTNIHFTYAIQLVYPQAFFPGLAKVSFSPFEFLIQSLKRTLAETVPWYWGVFDWLGVTLPRPAQRIINYLSVIALLGILMKIFLIFKKRDQNGLLLVYLLLVSIIYYLGIIYFNYLFFLANEYSFGIQGRYFFPTIIGHMAILMTGLLVFVSQKIWTHAIKLIAILMVFLNFIALGVLIKTYYPATDFNNLVLQMSQYKPYFLKAGMLLFWVISYFITLIIFIVSFLKANETKLSKRTRFN